MSRIECPSRSSLIDFHLGNSTEDQQDAIAEHLEHCVLCEKLLNELDGLVDEAVVSVRGTASLVGAPAAPHPASGPRPGPTPGMRVGDYEVVEEIGRGGMGLVWKARHVKLHRVVALKMLLSGEFASPEYRRRFFAEAEAVARLRHPNIVQIYEVGQWQSAGGAVMPFLALEYVDDGSLSERTLDRPQPAKVAAKWVETLARAVHHAHEQGVIHRDLKPSNVLFSSDGSLKLCDFGVAKVLAGPDLRTYTGLVIGTPEYMAPEQAAGQAQLVAPPADVWGLGAILYALLTGRPPFTAPDPLAVLRLVRQDDPVPPRQLQPSVPRDLETVCLKCLHKDPHKRYATAIELADDLVRFQQGRSVCARPTGTAEKTWKWVRRRPATASILLGVLLLLTVGLPGVTYLWLRADQARRLADDSLEEAETALYYNHVALARQGLDVSGVGQTRLMLERCLPTPGKRDRRDWEWHYLHRQAYAGSVPEMRHGQGNGWVQEVAWSPDGRRLASAFGLSQWSPSCRSIPGEVKVWDAASGRCEFTLDAHSGSVLTLAWSVDGQAMVSGGADGRVYQWDVTASSPTSQRLPVPIGPGEVVTRLRYSPDGKWLAIGSSRSFILWDLRAGKVLHSVAKPLWGVAALAFRPKDGADEKGGTQLLVGLVDERETALWRWDIPRRGEPSEQRFPTPPHVYTCVQFGRGESANVLALARAGSSEVEVWDAKGASRRERLRGHQGAVNSLSFAPNGQLATAGEDGTVRLWDPATGTEQVVYRGHVGGLMSVAFSPDGKRVASGGKDGAMCQWRTNSDPRGLRFRGTMSGAGEFLGGLAFEEDGKSVVVVSQLEKRVRRCDAATGDLIGELLVNIDPSPSNPRSDQALRPDGRLLAAPDPARRQVLKVWDTRDGTEIAALTGHDSQVDAVAWSADGKRLATGATIRQLDGASRCDVRIWEVHTGREVRRLQLEGVSVTSLALDREGHRLVAATRDGTKEPKEISSTPTIVQVWNTRTGRQEQRLEGATGTVTAMAFRPDGNQLAGVGIHARRVYTWDLVAPFTFLARPSLSTPTSVTYSPDGRRVVSGSFDNRVRMWDSRNLHEAIALPSLGAPGSGNYNYTAWVAFSPDGSRLAASDWSGTISLWDATPLTETDPR